MASFNPSVNFSKSSLYKKILCFSKKKVPSSLNRFLLSVMVRYKSSPRVLFTSKMTWGLTNKGILASPHIEFLKPSGYKKKDTWMKFSAVYKANGDEAAFILGPFKNSKSKRFRGFAHYYIDDVSIYPINVPVDTAMQAIEPEIQKEEFLPSIGRNMFFSQPMKAHCYPIRMLNWINLLIIYRKNLKPIFIFLDIPTIPETKNLILHCLKPVQLQ